MNTNETPSTPPSGTTDSISKVTPGTGDPPDTRKAISFLEGCKFDPNDDNLDDDNNNRGAPSEVKKKQKRSEDNIDAHNVCSADPQGIARATD